MFKAALIIVLNLTCYDAKNIDTGEVVAEMPCDQVWPMVSGEFATQEEATAALEQFRSLAQAYIDAGGKATVGAGAVISAQPPVDPRCTAMQDLVAQSGAQLNPRVINGAFGEKICEQDWPEVISK